MEIMHILQQSIVVGTCSATGIGIGTCSSTV